MTAGNSSIASSSRLANAGRLLRSQPIDEFSGTPYTYLNEACAWLDLRCTQMGRPFDDSDCMKLRSECSAAIAARNDCQIVRSACLTVSATRGVSITGQTTRRKSVHKLRGHGGRGGVDAMRLPIPRVKVSPRRRSGAQHCSSTAALNSTRVTLGNATLISPVWPNNFGETLLGTFYSLHAHPPDEALLLALALTPTQWAGYQQHWVELLDLTWPGAALHVLTASTVYTVDRLAVCHVHDVFDFGRRAFQRMQPSMLGALARHRLGLRRSLRPPWPVRVGIAVPGPHPRLPGRRIVNAEQLVERGCPPRATCKLVRLDHHGCAENLRTIRPLHALVALHGAHVTWSAFAERPFALLEVKPYTMGHMWFRKYHQTAFSLDTWTYAFEAGAQEHRPTATSNIQWHGAVLPIPVFRKFVEVVVRQLADEPHVTRWRMESCKRNMSSCGTWPPDN